MKKTMTLIIILLLAFILASAEDIATVIPDLSLWGISRKELVNTYESDFQLMEIGKIKVLHQSGIEINDRYMDIYYVFGYPTWKSNGYTYNGLSKIVYLLSDENEGESLNLEEVCQSFITSMKDYIGEPDSVSKAVTIWEKDGYKVEIGKGKFQKCNGSKKQNVAIVISGTDIPKPVTPPPTPQLTPEHTYIPPTPKPTRTPKPNKNSLSSDLKELYIDIGSRYIRSRYPGYTNAMTPTVKKIDGYIYVGFTLSGALGYKAVIVTIDPNTGQVIYTEAYP